MIIECNQTGIFITPTFLVFRFLLFRFPFSAYLLGIADNSQLYFYLYQNTSLLVTLHGAGTVM